MKRTIASHTSRRRAAVIVVTAIAAVAALAPSAQATFEGKSGPIAFQRFTDPNGESAQVFRLKPRTGRVRQLSSFAGGGFVPDYSPNGRRILFNSPFQDRAAIYR